MQLKTTFNHHCNCGGYASSMNGRDPEYPHMHWCAQYEEWMEYDKQIKETYGPTYSIPRLHSPKTLR